MNQAYNKILKTPTLHAPLSSSVAVASSLDKPGELGHTGILLILLVRWMQWLGKKSRRRRFFSDSERTSYTLQREEKLAQAAFDYRY